MFFGPVGFVEQCVSKKTDLTDEASEDAKPLSPLTTEQFVEIFKEANSIAIALQEETDSKTSVDGPVNQLTDSLCELALKSQPKVQDAAPVTTTPNKSEAEIFKRAIRKDMRSPRRTTYTVAVSPAGQPPPAHLPTAEECVSTLSKDKPLQIKFSAEQATATSAVAKNNVVAKAAVKKSRLPAKKSGIPKTSGIPRTSGLKKPTTVSAVMFILIVLLIFF